MVNLMNFVAFQVGWFACVLGAARGRPWLGPLVALPLLAWHLSGFERPGREAGFLAVVVAVGLVADSALERGGVLDYGAGGRLASMLCPVWILALWVLFGSTFHRSLAWLQDAPWLAVLLGGGGGALSYLAGARLGALRWPGSPRRSLWTLAATWAALVPALLWLAGRRVFLPEGGEVSPGLAP